MSAISIPKGSIKLAGLLFKPSTLTRKLPGIIILHPAGGLKEQTVSIYAKKLSERGHVVICFDAAHQGESEGLPRYLEDPAVRVSDASAVADYLQGLDYVDPNRVGIVGVCAGGGYATAAASNDHRFKAVALVSPVNMGLGVRLGRRGEDDAAQKLILFEQAAQARQAEAQGGEPVLVPIVQPLGESPSEEDRKVHDYYMTPRGQHPRWVNRMLLYSLPLLANFDPWRFADIYLKQPVLIIVGENSAQRWQAEALFNRLDGNNKGLKNIIVPKGGHVDFYDQDEYVSPAVDEIVKFFKPVF